MVIGCEDLVYWRFDWKGFSKPNTPTMECLLRKLETIQFWSWSKYRRHGRPGHVAPKPYCAWACATDALIVGGSVPKDHLCIRRYLTLVKDRSRRVLASTLVATSINLWTRKARGITVVGTHGNTSLQKIQGDSEGTTTQQEGEHTDVPVCPLMKTHELNWRAR